MSAERSFEVLCTVRVSHTFENLSAHVELDGDLDIGPGDTVLVHGRPINPPYGEVQVERRRATITRASWLRRHWSRLVGNLDCLVLLDVSVTDESPRLTGKPSPA